ncbi:AraC family transcriptional regulator [Gracilimonas mengyeensis]|uniref:HTH araC/xylS-type domain-containing protein n=1 Tax=Gracilimonas mengyeensis TaxID=1302730 RepID=A0A521E643_9BACT|nr:AraC family transcriptional regulator [Gracilimonas mengyeensis]SMO78650.1 hypothetical protein SAMN06265219_110134 [Gracilimonas mengyeensis]
MTVDEKRKMLARIEANKIKKILSEEISQIRHVKDWAEFANCSTTKLNKTVKIHFGISAKKMMKEVRFISIKTVLSNAPYCGSYNLAQISGLSNEQELYKFLKINFNTTYTDLKYEILINRMYI